MNKILNLFLAICFFLACSPNTRNTDMYKSNLGSDEIVLADNEVIPQHNLESYLRRASGVVISGSGQNATVRVRGVNSINSNTQPIFIVNGMDIGQDYAKAASLVQPLKIKSVKVLKGADATLYGVRGGGGVIVIKAD